MRDFKSFNLANVAWAFATGGHKEERLFTALGAAAERRMMDFKSQELVNTAWAFAMVGNKEEGLFTALATAAERSLRNFNAQGLANAAWAFTTGGHREERLLTALAAAAERRMRDFNSHELAKASWAFATVAHKDERVFSTLPAAAEQCMRDLKSQEHANAAWAQELRSCKEQPQSAQELPLQSTMMHTTSNGLMQEENSKAFCKPLQEPGGDNMAKGQQNQAPQWLEEQRFTNQECWYRSMRRVGKTQLQNLRYGIDQSWYLNLGYDE